MNTASLWLFLSELLLIAGTWILMAELSADFNQGDFFKKLLHDKILKEDQVRQKRQEHNG